MNPYTTKTLAEIWQRGRDDHQAGREYNTRWITVAAKIAYQQGWMSA